MYRATSFCEREKSSKRSVMKSERLLRAGWALVAVRATAAHFAPGAGFPSCLPANVVGSPPMTLERALRAVNRNMIAFGLALGAGALLAPTATLRVMGHDEPS